MNPDKYSIALHFVEDDEGGYWHAYHPELGASACSAPGDSPENAIARLREVREVILALWKDWGKDLPEPDNIDAFTKRLGLGTHLIRLTNGDALRLKRVTAKALANLLSPTTTTEARIRINNTEYEATKPVMSGMEILALAGKSFETHMLHAHDTQHKISFTVLPTDLVDVENATIERFSTLSRSQTGG